VTNEDCAEIDVCRDETAPARALRQAPHSNITGEVARGNINDSVPGIYEQHASGAHRSETASFRRHRRSCQIPLDPVAVYRICLLCRCPDALAGVFWREGLLCRRVVVPASMERVSGVVAMSQARVLVVGSFILVGVISACSGGARPTEGTSAADTRSPVVVDTTAVGSRERPTGVVALGHSEMTGYGTDPSSPGTDTVANSWATGTNPAVRSIYMRLVEVRPETAGNVSNAAEDGATADRLPFQATQGLRRVPHPALALVQIVGNDIRCDGTDPAHYAEFGASVRRAVMILVKASPKVGVVLIGEPMRPASLAAAIASLPTTPSSFISDEPCYLFSANRTVNQVEVHRVTRLLRAYELQLAMACRGIPQCHTDGGAAARMKTHFEDLGVDLQHPSMIGHARLAAAEWPVTASLLGTP
jgi:hypothetical protein